MWIASVMQDFLRSKKLCNLKKVNQWHKNNQNWYRRLFGIKLVWRVSLFVSIQKYITLMPKISANICQKILYKSKKYIFTIISFSLSVLWDSEQAFQENCLHWNLKLEIDEKTFHFSIFQFLNNDNKWRNCQVKPFDFSDI